MDQDQRLPSPKKDLVGQTGFLHVLKNLRQTARSFQNKKWTRRLMTILWILLVGFILWGMWKYRLQIIPYLQHANYFNLVITSIFYVIAIAFACFGWITVIRPFTPDLKPWKHIYIYCATLASRRLPGTIWYIGGRLTLYKQLGISQLSISIASTIEIVISIVSGCIVSLALFPFGLKLSGPVMGLMGLGILLGLIAVHPKILERLFNKLGRPLSQKINYKDTLIWLIAYSGSWITGGLMFYFLINTFQPLLLDKLMFVLVSWSTSGVAGLLTIFLPSSFGVTDLSLSAFTATLLPLPMAVVIAIINRIFISLIEVILSAIFYFFLKLE